MPLRIIVYRASVIPQMKFCGLGKLKLLKTSFLPKNSSFFAKIPTFGSEYVKIKLPQKEA